jgi:hypothetical protein
MAPATFTAVPLVVLLAVGMPRFSARLLAIEGWGSRRRDVGGVGEEDALLLVALLEADFAAPSEV